jgi:hypothetical protein
MANPILTWISYAWCAALFLQNVGIAIGAMEAVGPPNDATSMARSYLWWAAGRMLVISVAVLAFARHRSMTTLLTLSATIVLAFPLSAYAERLLLTGRAAPGEMLLSVSALCSYAAATLLFVANRELLRSSPAAT